MSKMKGWSPSLRGDIGDELDCTAEPLLILLLAG